jgi:ferrous iron transport protein A
MTLLDVPEGRCARLISAGERLRSRLKQQGLHLGDQVQIVRRGSFGGPLLVELNGREIALGRTVAQKILVEVE